MNSSNDSYGSYQKSSGRDGTAPSKSKRSRNETGSTRSIIYPEDVELQSDDRSDKEVRVDRVEDHAQYGDAVSKLKLGLKPSVTTEIKVGTPGSTSSRPVPSSQWGRGIEVKHDLVVTKEGF